MTDFHGKGMPGASRPRGRSETLRLGQQQASEQRQLKDEEDRSQGGPC
jgi:hypothetical protein